MIGHIVYKIFYGYNFDLSDAILIYTNIGGNIKSVKVLNEPILDWELDKAGSITLKLSPSNAGYDEIKCKQGCIFVHKDGVLIWHGRAISDTYDIDGNREIICEGALNYLLDTRVSPRNSHNEGTAQDIFEGLLDTHNREQACSTSLIFGRGNWVFSETNGTVSYHGSDDMLWPIMRQYPGLYFKATGNTEYGLFAWSNPSIWQYSMHWNHRIRVSFHINFTKGSPSDRFIYGLHLRDQADVSNGVGTRYAYVENSITDAGSIDIDTEWHLGPGGLDAPNHDGAYIGMHLYLVGSAGASAIISNIKVEQYEFEGANYECSFLPHEGERTAFGKQTWAPKEYWSLEDSDYPTVLDVINDKFINQQGGHIYVGYETVNNALRAVLNYISGDPTYDNVDESAIPKVVFGKNLVSFKKTTNYEDYANTFIPLGAQLEDLDKTYKVTGITYDTGKSLNKDGIIKSESDARHTIAKIPVNHKMYSIYDEVYYVTGIGRKDYGFYTLVDANFNVVDHQTYSSKSSNEYSAYEDERIDIPKESDAKILIVYFFNEHNDPLDRAFSVKRYNFGDREERISLENYIGDRTDYYAGTKYYIPSTVNMFNTIEQVVEFEDVETQAELLSTIRKYCDELEQVATTYEVDAVDLAPISDETDNYSLGTPGSYARVIYPKLKVDEILCVTKCSINLRDFSKSKYSLANLPPPNLSDLIAKGTINERTNNFAF